MKNKLQKLCEKERVHAYQATIWRALACIGVLRGMRNENQQNLNTFTGYRKPISIYSSEAVDVKCVAPDFTK